MLATIPKRDEKIRDRSEPGDSAESGFIINIMDLNPEPGLVDDNLKSDKKMKKLYVKLYFVQTENYCVCPKRVRKKIKLKFDKKLTCFSVIFILYLV